MPAAGKGDHSLVRGIPYSVVDQAPPPPLAPPALVATAQEVPSASLAMGVGEWGLGGGGVNQIDGINGRGGETRVESCSAPCVSLGASPPTADPLVNSLFHTPPGFPFSFPPAVFPPTAVEGSPGAACGAPPPSLLGEGVQNPAANGYTALAAQIAEQASASARLQEQLVAVLADGQRREAEARRREAQQTEEAARRQAESSASFQALADTLAAAQVQSAQRFSVLEASLNA